MRTVAILLNILAACLILLHVRGDISAFPPLVWALLLAASVTGLIALYLARSQFMGSRVRPPQKPTIVADVYQDFDEARWSVTFYALCAPTTKVIVEDYFFPTDLETRIGYQLPPGAERQAKDPKKKHLYVPAVLVQQRLKPGRPVHVSFTANNLADAHGKIFFSINFEYIGGGGVQMLGIPIGRDWEAMESFQNDQRRKLVAALKSAGYPPF